MFNKLCCPDCKSEKCSLFKNYSTMNNGARELYICNNCMQTFSETKGTFLEGIRKSISFIVTVFKARSNGLGFNATCECFGIAKNTLYNWERKFSNIKQSLFLYAILHNFLSQIIEGDELYTKVGKNVPVEDCQGWTIVLMERASRFIWALECGKKDKYLFIHALKLLKYVIERTKDLTLVTDGERRYGSILFEICCEVTKSKNPKRLLKVLRQGLKVRLKNKGDRSRKKNRARQKYEAPQPEHPNTIQNLPDSEIHANHVEALNASIRRKNSAFRRKTNTYAKNQTALQRTLDIYWIVHNFIQEHFTTQQVPAVALGIIKEGFSWEQIFKLRKNFAM